MEVPIDEYVVHGIDRSLFTRKLEAALDFYGAPYRREERGMGAGGELQTRANTHQIPILHTPDDWVIADTTPILMHLDARFPARRLFPAGPLGVLVHVVEEVLDEWLARVMVHYRWHYPENTASVVSEFTGRAVTLDEAQNHPAARWGPRACRATGTEHPAQQKAAEQEYLGLLGALEAQLDATRFALGDRPTAADAMLIGGIRAHTGADPIPDLSGFASVLHYESKTARGWDGSGTLAGFPESTPFGGHVLALARDQYAPFLLGNARTLAAGDKAFVIDTYGEPTSYLARAYPERSRRLLRARVRDQLTSAERDTVIDWLQHWGLAECFAP